MDVTSRPPRGTRGAGAGCAIRQLCRASVVCVRDCSPVHGHEEHDDHDGEDGE